jgi:ketosteroid isomerase-like protein
MLKDNINNSRPRTYFPIYATAFLLSIAGSFAQTSVKDQVEKVNRDFNQALLDKNTTVLQQIYADSAVIVGAQGFSVIGSGQLIDLIKKGYFYYINYSLTDTKVFTYENTGIVTGVLNGKVFAFGQINTIHERYTASFHLMKNQWKLLSIQYTIIGEDDKKAIASVGQVHESFRQALLKADTSALNRIYTADFTATTPTGQLFSKEDLIKNIASRSVKYEQLNYSQTSLRSYGPTVIITSLVNFRISRNGKRDQGIERYTGTYVKSGGEWHLAALHFSTPKN